MCGIVGKYFFKDQAVDSDLLNRQVQSIKHRGPDDHGIWSDQNVGLGHVRLSIIDLSEAGHQPMLTNDQRGVMIFNGEVYNFQDLRRKLSARNYNSTTDTEVVLNAIQEQGIKAFNLMEGMFSLAYYNRVSEDLIIARDHFGIKPLYYTVNESRIAFASEIRPLLLEPGVSAHPDNEALKEYFLLGYSIDPKTCYQDIKRLPPGHYLKISRKGLEVVKYWEVSSLIDHQKNEEDWYEELCASMRLHSISDVPIGLLLSGGMDSTLMLKILKENNLIDLRFSSYNAGLAGSGQGKVYWEREVAEQSSRYYGTPLTRISSDPASFMSFEAMIRIIEEPISNPSNYLIDKICEHANSNGHKVLFSGHGGDEIFGGYRRHLVARYLPVLRGLLPLLKLWENFNYSSLIFRVNQALDGTYKNEIFPLVAIGLDLVKKMELTKGWITNEDLHRISSDLEPHTPPGMKLSPLKRQMISEYSTYLSCQNLINMDKISMHHSIEVRVPFLYRPLVAIGLNTPDSRLIKGKKTKAIYRERGSELLPDFVTNKPKSGFGPSLRDLIQTEEIKDLIYSKNFAERGQFETNSIKKHFYERDISVNDALQLMNIATVEQWLQNNTSSTNA